MTTKTLLDLGLSEAEGIAVADLLFPEGAAVLTAAQIAANILKLTRSPRSMGGLNDTQKRALMKAGRTIRTRQRAGQLPDPTPIRHPANDGSGDLEEKQPFDPAGAPAPSPGGTGLPPILPAIPVAEAPRFAPQGPQRQGQDAPLLGGDHPIAQHVAQDAIDDLEGQRERVQDLIDAGRFVGGAASGIARIIEINRQIAQHRQRIRDFTGGQRGPGPVQPGKTGETGVKKPSTRMVRSRRRRAEQPTVGDDIPKRSTRRTLAERREGFSNINVMQQAHANYMNALGRWNTTFSRTNVQFPPAQNIPLERARGSLIDMGLGGTLARR